MRHYDPLEAPEPEEWLALDEAERNRLAERYHRRLLAPLGVTAPSLLHQRDHESPWCRNRLLISAFCDIVNI